MKWRSISLSFVKLEAVQKSEPMIITNEPELANMEKSSGILFENMVQEFELASMARVKKTRQSL